MIRPNRTSPRRPPASRWRAASGNKGRNSLTYRPFLRHPAGTGDRYDSPAKVERTIGS
jgi:hypothetical protein